MADNVEITAGSGTPIATDDVGGIQYQRVKLDLGGNGVSDPVESDLPVSLKGHTSGGLAVHNSIDVDETEENVKTSPGQLYTIYAFNNAATVRYLRFYNDTAANTTVGSTAAALGPFGIPAGGGFVWNNELGIEFDTAICIAATTGVAANDAGAPDPNDVVVVLGYV